LQDSIFWCLTILHGKTHRTHWLCSMDLFSCWPADSFVLDSSP
jgi:hypothetical protein